VLERPVLAFPDDRGTGKNDRQQRQLIDDGHDARKPGGYAVWIEHLAHDQIKRFGRLLACAAHEARDALIDDVPDVPGSDAGLLHGGRIDIHL